jgi:acyl-CoA synthetase (AMP-forming)/AMP-acid ligase II
MAAQVDALRRLYGITATDRLVAAFAPFALYGPALGIASTIPDVDVTTPGALTAAAFTGAVASIDATIAFASPAALANVVRTAQHARTGADAPPLDSLRLVLSAGAPVPIATLRATGALCPNATLHTPYGMTECLPVADVGLDEIEGAMTQGAGGVCVGRPVQDVEVMITPFGRSAGGDVVPVTGSATGEILVRAPWLSSGYDQLWSTEHAARPHDDAGRVWHRTGDVGHIDDAGRLWVEGRTVHVIDSDLGPLTPVPIEVAVERLDGVDQCAAVGVGPAGCRQLVVVVADPHADEGVAGAALAARVRATVRHPVAAVLLVRELPVDIRHNTKIDRTAVARWAAAVLAGGHARRPW